MAKSSGGTRILKTGSRNWTARQREVLEMQDSGKYSSVEFSEQGGGYVAIEKSKKTHKAEEIEAAQMLANKGYKVILKDEAGQIRTPDGYVFSATFEQRTPTKDGANTVRNALFHGRDKKTDVVVIYSKGHIVSRKSIEEGIKLFEDASSKRFERILVVADNGNVHVHKHNK